MYRTGGKKNMNCQRTFKDFLCSEKLHGNFTREKCGKIVSIFRKSTTSLPNLDDNKTR
jgi:hypothetical protein